MSFVFAGARSSYLQRREIELRFQLQQLAEAQSQLQSTLGNVYTYTNPDPNNPINTGPNQMFVGQLQAWDLQLKSTMERLKQELKMAEAEKPGQDKRFEAGVKSFYDMMV
jgi:flagellar hook-associated protein FlgK